MRSTGGATAAHTATLRGGEVSQASAHNRRGDGNSDADVVLHQKAPPVDRQRGDPFLGELDESPALPCDGDTSGADGPEQQLTDPARDTTAALGPKTSAGRLSGPVASLWACARRIRPMLSPEMPI